MRVFHGIDEKLTPIEFFTHPGDDQWKKRSFLQLILTKTCNQKTKCIYQLIYFRKKGQAQKTKTSFDSNYLIYQEIFLTMVCNCKALYLISSSFFSASPHKQLSYQIIAWSSLETDVKRLIEVGGESKDCQLMRKERFQNVEQKLEMGEWKKEREHEILWKRAEREILKFWQVRDWRGGIWRIIQKKVFNLITCFQRLFTCNHGTKLFPKPEPHTVLVNEIILVNLWQTEIILVEIIATKWGTIKVCEAS